MKQTLLVFTFILIALAAGAETVVLFPTDDMYTDPDHAGTPPVVTELWTADFATAGHFERIMMRFDLSPYLERDLNSATLHLTRFFSCPSSGTTASNFYAIDEEWDEDSWDHTVHISYDDTYAMPYVFSGTGGTANVEFDVNITDFLDNWFTDRIPNYGFLIMANSGQKFSKFYSKEHSNESYRPTLTLELAEVDVTDEDAPAPALHAMNYPNPFNPSTTIRYQLVEAGHVAIDVYNVEGRHVCRLHSGHTNAGTHQVHWDGHDDSGNAVSSGVYLYKVATAAGTLTRPMVLMK